MDNPVDNIIDLGLVNYVKHPSDPSYIVFRFPDENRANSFEAELVAAEIWFERSSEQKSTRLFHLFGIHKNDFKKAEKINFRVEGMHKKPLIPFKALRYGLILFSATVMTLAIMGYCESRKKLQSVNEAITAIDDNSSSAN